MAAIFLALVGLGCGAPTGPGARGNADGAGEADGSVELNTGESDWDDYVEAHDDVQIAYRMVLQGPDEGPEWVGYEYYEAVDGDGNVLCSGSLQMAGGLLAADSCEGCDRSVGVTCDRWSEVGDPAECEFWFASYRGMVAKWVVAFEPTGVTADGVEIGLIWGRDPGESTWWEEGLGYRDGATIWQEEVRSAY